MDKKPEPEQPQSAEAQPRKRRPRRTVEVSASIYDTLTAKAEEEKRTIRVVAERVITKGIEAEGTNLRTEEEGK